MITENTTARTEVQPRPPGITTYRLRQANGEQLPIALQREPGAPSRFVLVGTARSISPERVLSLIASGTLIPSTVEQTLASA